MSIRVLKNEGKNKICIFYFSGTGNTAWAVHKLAEKLSALDYEIKLISCEDEIDLSSEVECCDIVGFAFPIHSSFAPKLFQGLLNKLPKCKDKPLIALTTAGYMAGDVLWYTLKSLKSRGYVPIVFSNIIIGNNMHLPVLCPLPVTKPNNLLKKLTKAERKIDKMVNHIEKDKLHIEGTNPVGRLFGIIQRGIASNFESLAFKGFYSDESCTKCGWCIKTCPNNNIQMDNKEVKILGNCMICMRCYSFCPSHSIQMTMKTKNLKKYKRYKGPEGKRL